jgi:hypothetical protein
VIVRAAEYLKVSLPFFMIGATLRYIARKQQQDSKNKKLNAIELPEQYVQ